MNYYLIANNKKLTKNILSGISKENSCIVLYNFLYPISIYPDLLKYSNIIYISRQVTSFLNQYNQGVNNIFPYAGMNIAKKYERYFSKIIFHSNPEYLSEPRKTLYKKYIDDMNFNKNKLGLLEPYSFNIRNKIKYPLGKNMSTGIISYAYFKTIKTIYDTITLVGFTSDVSTKHHNKNFEKLFFEDEVKNHHCKVLN
jgi:hypothetical protein